MKKIAIISTIILAFGLTSFADEPFEGEIVYKTQESYSKCAKKYLPMPAVDGEHVVHLYVKGDKLHQYDELTSLHMIWDDGKKEGYWYLDQTAKGINMTECYETLSLANPKGFSYKGASYNVIYDNWKPTGEKSNVLEQECEDWFGDLKNSGNGMSYVVEKAASLCAIDVPQSYHRALWGLDTNCKMPLSWTLHFDYGKVPLFGAYEWMIKGEVTEIKKGSVDEAVFEVPASYDIMKYSTKNVMKFLKNVHKAQKERGI